MVAQFSESQDRLELVPNKPMLSSARLTSFRLAQKERGKVGERQAPLVQCLCLHNLSLQFYEKVYRG